MWLIALSVLSMWNVDAQRLSRSLLFVLYFFICKIKFTCLFCCQLNQESLLKLIYIFFLCRYYNDSYTSCGLCSFSIGKCARKRYCSQINKKLCHGNLIHEV